MKLVSNKLEIFFIFCVFCHMQLKIDICIICLLNKSKKRLGDFWTKYGNPGHSDIGKTQTPSVFVLTKNPNGRYMVIRGAICVSPTAY